MQTAIGVSVGDFLVNVPGEEGGKSRPGKMSLQISDCQLKRRSGLFSGLERIGIGKVNQNKSNDGGQRD